MIFSDRLIGDGEALPEGKTEMLKKIASSAERMSGLINGLLEYSRLAHHGDLFEPTDLNGIMREILSDFELLIEQKNARMDIGELPVLEAIPVQIYQLLTNLIGNALKFSNEGVPPIVQVSSRPFPEEAIKKHPSLKAGIPYHEIIVKDNGIGFDQKYGEHIFIIFQRLRESRLHKGTGMGLSLVKRITENHNGAAHAVSGEGGGATFHVILPVEQPE
jgi:two-component system CheB/CheR fusion protein